MKFGHRIGLVDDYCYNKCIAILGILLYILGCYKTFKTSVKTSEKNGENSKEILKPNLEQNIKLLLHNHLVYIYAEETDFR